MGNEKTARAVGERIEELRKKKGITQIELAKILGVKRVTVTQWETGVQNIKMIHIVPIAEYFGVSCDFLLGRSRTAAADETIQDVYNRIGLCDEAIAVLEGMFAHTRNTFSSNDAESSNHDTFVWKMNFKAHSMLNFLLENGMIKRNESDSVSLPIRLLAGLYDYLIAKHENESNLTAEQRLQLIALDLHGMIHELRLAYRR